MAKHKPVRTNSKIPTVAEENAREAANQAEEDSVSIEGEEGVVDKLLSDLLSVKDLKEAKNVLLRTSEGLKKIVEEQNGKIRALTEENSRLKKTKAFTAEDENKLFQMFGEISFDRKSGTGERVVKIKGQRSSKFRVSSPSLFEALEALRNS